MATVRHYEKFARRIGIVCDQILYDTIGSAADFVYVRYGDEWRESISGIDCLLVVSTWRGLANDDWRGIAKEGTPQRARIFEIIAACRERGTPVVFYSKEDPPNYASFIDIARKCDFVFTSAEEMISRYIEDCGHGRVAVLRFCVDPARQNPIESKHVAGSEGAMFAGSWMIKYPDRCSALKILFDGAIKSGKGLCIFDRNSSSKSVSMQYPRRYGAFVKPAVEHDALHDLHKAHRWSINVNSVTESASMFAGRCYELLACGCPVLSNYSYGMSRVLPAVAVMHSSEDVSRTMRIADAGLLQLRRSIGIRKIMSGNTCYDRIGEILLGAGFPDAQPRRAAAVVAPIVDDKIRRMFDAQTYAEKSLFKESEFDEAAFVRFDYVARWEPSLDYGVHYLEDMVNAFKFGEFDFATERGNCHTTTSVHPVLERTMIWRRSFSYADFAARRCPDGMKGLAIPDNGQAAFPSGVKSSPGKIAEVRISVRRDVEGLAVRSIPSLRRSKFFGRFAISLCDVDRGDSATMEIVSVLCAMYPGIVRADGASCGLPWLSMFASDEVLCPGFDAMLSKASESSEGEVSGGLLLCGRTRRLVDGGVVMAKGRGGASRRMDAPVLARYAEAAETDGRLWTDPPLKRAPIWKRAYGCYQDNGLLYTIRRVVFGKKSVQS